MELTYKGETFDYDEHRRLTYTEAVLMKTICGGAEPARVRLMRMLDDPEAWKATLFVAMRRAGQTVDAQTDFDGDAFELPGSEVPVDAEAPLPADGPKARTRKAATPPAKDAPAPA